MIYQRAADLAAATLALQSHRSARVLAGGQSLVAAMKLGMLEAELLIDLQALPELGSITMRGAQLEIGAMATHHAIATSAIVRDFCPMLFELAGGIADQQVRYRGTIGGSLAHNDPAACWPTAALGLGATILTTQREIAADDFFQAVYTTTLRRDEIIVAIRFERPTGAHYIKFEQLASRFALVGVVVSRLRLGVRVAVTGLGHGVARWEAAEHALNSSFAQTSLDAVPLGGLEATSDLHASGEYRLHLARVLSRRAVAAILSEVSTSTTAFISPATSHAEVNPRPSISGSHVVAAPIEAVWRSLLDSTVLARCVPGCESMVALDSTHYEAAIRVGLGPISALFKSRVRLFDLRAPQQCKIAFEGVAGALGSGSGTASVLLTSEFDHTTITWQAETQLTGRMAQLGSRLTEATAKKLTAEFFNSFANTFSNPAPKRLSWWRRLLKGLFRS